MEKDSNENKQEVPEEKFADTTGETGSLGKKFKVKSKINTGHNAQELAEIAREILKNVSKHYEIMVKLHNLGYTSEKFEELKKIIKELKQLDYNLDRNTRSKLSKHSEFMHDFNSLCKNFDEMIRIYNYGYKNEGPRRKITPKQVYKTNKIYNKFGIMQKFMENVNDDPELREQLNKHYPQALRNSMETRIEEVLDLYKDFKFLQAQIQEDLSKRDDKKEILYQWLKMLHKVCITGIGNSQMLEKLGLQVSPYKPRKESEDDENPDDQPDGNEPDVSPNNA